MKLQNLVPFYRPKQDSESSNGTDTGADTGTNATTGLSIGLGKPLAPKVEKAIAEMEGNQQAIDASFLLALQQGNGPMVYALQAAGHTPSPTLLASDGKTVESKLKEMTKGPDEQARAADRNPILALSANTLAQVNSVQLDAGQWVRGLSLTNSPTLPLVTQQRSIGYGMAV